MVLEQRSAADPAQWSQVCIVGLGLIGGSVALALRKHWPQLRLVGIDRDEVVSAGNAALPIDQCTSEHDALAVEQALAGSDLVVLATPVNAIRRWLPAALAHPTLVTDCGSTKRDIVSTANASGGLGRFVPGHPMAGTAGRSGASADLFEGRPWMLCAEGVDPADLESVEVLVSSFGARPVRLSAAAHDRAVAWTSHAPRVMASALAVLAERERAIPAAGPAFERLLRGAGGSPRVWADVLGSNADEVARALRLLIAELSACAAELEGPGGTARSLDALSAAERVRRSVEASARSSTEDE
jgi:prephenate dehydrogenase